MPLTWYELPIKSIELTDTKSISSLQMVPTWQVRSFKVAVARECTGLLAVTP